MAPGLRGLGESETPGGVLISVLNVVLDFPQLDTNAQPPSLRVLLPLKVLPALTLAGLHRGETGALFSGLYLIFLKAG